ncbi:Hypothetical protein PHPALM_20009 [Phytophthora palmivora]|uniref:Integrase catalytic domain-containing protein n=1 Tax=Phytophthora palmivora TaxID=4796 RepID=A0A2P4XFX5_9STRA|nr:Hypothetical protein PHPALM_20009 [Phytophthora palmivora]
MPWTNGTVETVNRDIWQVLRVMILESQLDIRNWVHHLPLIQAYHSPVPWLSKYASVGLFTGLPAPSALYIVMPEHKLPPGIGSNTSPRRQMKRAKKDCCWGNLVETSPCSVCSQPVHRLCSNELCTNAGLSKSRQCVRTFFTVDGDAAEFTPSRISGISVTSEGTVVDLRRDKEEVVTATTNSIPDEIIHYAQASNFIWQMIHKLEKPMSHKHRTEAVKEKNRRLQRASRFTEVKPNIKEQKQPRRIEEQARDTKLQKTASQDQISGIIARWLIKDGKLYILLSLSLTHSCTPRFTLQHDYYSRLQRAYNPYYRKQQCFKLPSSKTFYDILDKAYDNFEKDTKVMLSKEFMELHETPFLTLEHDL